MKEDIRNKLKNITNKKPRVVNVLGTNYTVEWKLRSEDSGLVDSEGYCDPISKRIVILSSTDFDPSDVDSAEGYMKKILKHELVHATFCESGINSVYLQDSEELIVEWIASQFNKLLDIFKEAGAL